MVYSTSATRSGVITVAAAVILARRSVAGKLHALICFKNVSIIFSIHGNTIVTF